MICKIVCSRCPAQYEIARWKSIAVGCAILAAMNFAALCVLAICGSSGGAM